MAVFGDAAHRTVFEKAAAMAEAIVRNHPFNDGNHRTGLFAAHLVLGLFDMMLVAPDDEQRDVIMKLGDGTVSLGDFSVWLEQNCVSRSRPN
jgi:death-on-curing protein